MSIEGRALIAWQLLIGTFAVTGGASATYALTACTAADIVAQDPGCPAGSGSCSITKLFTVADGCTLNFGSRAVTIAANASGPVITATPPASITISAGSLVIAPGGFIDARGKDELPPGNVGGAVTILTTGVVNIQKLPNNAGRIDVSATTSGGDVTIVAGGTVTVAGRINADRLDANHPLGDAGTIEIDTSTDIIVPTGGLLSVFGGNLAPEGGGEVDLTADGAIQMSGEIDLGGSSGGTLNALSGTTILMATVTGNATGDGADGATITLEAGTSLQVTDVLTANGSESPTFGGGGSGGTVSLSADYGDITVIAGAVIHADGADGAIGGAGDGGEVDLIAQGNVLIQKAGLTRSHVTASGGAPDAGGGLIDIEPGLKFQMDGTLDASGGGAGGEVDVTAGSDIALNGEVAINGRSPAGFGGTASIAAGDEGPGALTIADLINVNGYPTCDLLLGCGGGGSTALSGCNVTITANGSVTANGPTGGNNFITAYEQLTITGKLRANTTLTTGDGTNALEFPSRKPVIMGATSVQPAASLNARATCTALVLTNCLTPCPACGNGIVEFPEKCDNDVAVGGALPKSCDGCSTFCQLENCDDGKQCTTDSCSQTLGCRNLPVTAPCTEGPSPTPTSTPTVTHTPTMSATPTSTPTPTITATRTATPIASLTPTVTATLTLTPTPVRPGGCAATPLAGCRTPGISYLRLVNAVDKPKTKNRLTWRWRGLGGLTSISDFGNPIFGGMGYRICLYDTSADVPALTFGASAPPAGLCKKDKSCWKPTASGYKYFDGDYTPDGLAKVVLKAGVQDKARIVVTGVGPNLKMPPPIGTAVLKQDTTVMVQFARSDESVCWQSVYGLPAKKNLMPVFRDTLP